MRIERVVDKLNELSFHDSVSLFHQAILDLCHDENFVGRQGERGFDVVQRFRQLVGRGLIAIVGDDGYLNEHGYPYRNNIAAVALSVESVKHTGPTLSLCTVILTHYGKGSLILEAEKAQSSLRDQARLHFGEAIADAVSSFDMAYERGLTLEVGLLHPNFLTSRSLIALPEARNLLGKKGL